MLGSLTEIRCLATGRTLVLRRAWPRRPGHLLVEYDDVGVPVAGQWFVDRDQGRRIAEETAAVAGADEDVTWDDTVGVMLQRGGADRRLPALRQALAGEGASLVVHRPERRAVVRQCVDGTTAYLKIVRPGRALPRAPVVSGVRIPAVRAVDRDGGVVECAELPGATLHDLLGDTGASSETVGAWHATGRTVRALHHAPVPAGTDGHGPEGEVGVAARWVGHAMAHRALPVDDLVRAAAALDRLRSSLGALPAPPALALVHRDLHDKQVVVDGRGDVGLLDLDTLALGDPALDVANLVVHLELRALQGWCSADAAGAARAAFLEGYGPDGALGERVAAYAAATRLRLACVYAFRPRWAGVARRLVASP